MQRYVQQLVDEFSERATRLRAEREAARRKADAEAPSYPGPLDDEARMAAFRAEMEGIESWLEGPKPGITQPLAHYVEVDTDALPPPEKLSEPEARALFDALNSLLRAFNHSVDEVATEDCPATLYYAQMLRVLAEPTVMIADGDFGHGCCSHPPDCEFGRYCGCTQYYTEAEYRRQGGTHDIPPERFQSEADRAAFDATMAAHRAEHKAKAPATATSPAVDLAPLQSAVDEWIDTTGVRYFSELTNTAILAEEVGEVARLAARIHGEQSFKREADAASAKTDWADELSDVLFVLTCLANQTGVDLTAAFEKGMTKRTQRDAERHKRNEKLGEDWEDLPF